MIVEIDIPDLVTVSKAINNAGAAYQRMISMIDVGVELPPQFQKLYMHQTNSSISTLKIQLCSL